MTDEREQILARVQSALAPLPQRAALPDWDCELLQLPQHLRPESAAWNQFARRFQAVNGIAFTEISHLVLFLDKNGWRRGYCDPELWSGLKDAFPPTFHVETTYERARIDDYDFGVTRATAAIAETGTLILTDRDTPRRLAALAPWVHIAAVSEDQILPDIPDALAAMPPDPNIVWVTGPSKTADVEGILIEGVHGPGAQIALRLNSRQDEPSR